MSSLTPISARRIIGFLRRAASRPPQVLFRRLFVRFRQRRDRNRDWSSLTSLPKALTRAEIHDTLGSRFALSSSEIDQVVTLLNERDGDWQSGVVSRADAIASGQSFVYGQAYELGTESAKWHLDARSGLEFQADQYCFDCSLLDFGRPSDVRVVWELNRLHSVVDLGKAFRLTRDAKYYTAFEDTLFSWIEGNPIGRGVNWACPMELSIRAINIIWATSLFSLHPEFSDATVNRIMGILAAHGRFIRRYLEYSDLRNNHYLADLLGLLAIGMFLPELPESKKWIDFAFSRLEVDIRLQIHRDGVDYEGSIPYHQLVLEIFLQAAVISSRLGRDRTPEFRDRLNRMLDFALSYTKPNGDAPNFGDSDDGRIVILGDQSWRDHRHLLSTGAVIFDRPELAAGAGRLWEETLWMTGPRAASRFSSFATEDLELRSAAFSDGGFYVMRSDDFHVVIDAGDVGMRGRGGHGHHDVLSFVLSIGANPVIIDTGCSGYTSDVEERHRILSVAAHNTPSIDSSDIASVDTWGFLQGGATPFEVLEWSSDDAEDRLVAEHYGYRSLQKSVTVRRAFTLLKSEKSFVIEDEFSGEGEHRVTVPFHFDPSTTVTVAEGEIHVRMGSVEAILSASPAASWSRSIVRVYPEYGVAAETTRIVYETTMTVPDSIRFTLRPVQNQS